MRLSFGGVARQQWTESKTIMRGIEADKDVLKFVDEKRFMSYGCFQREKPNRWTTKVTRLESSGKKKKRKISKVFEDEADETRKRATSMRG